MTTSTKLSPTQRAMIARLLTATTKGERCPFIGGRDAGRVASGWYRTAESLRAAGLAIVQRTGDSKTAWLPQFAPQWALGVQS
jgi:hypothetical protein